MNDPNQAAADHLMRLLPNDVKQKLRSIAREHGKNRHATRATRKVIQQALAKLSNDAQRDATRVSAKFENDQAMAARIRGRLARGLAGPVAGMSQDRYDYLVALPAEELALEELVVEEIVVGAGA
jgi:uncharacterized membrane protein